MTIAKTLRAAALAGTGLSSLAALAQQQSSAPSGEAAFGMAVQGANSALYGRYNGDWNKGARETGEFDLHGADPWNSGGTFYYDIYGRNLDASAGNVLPEGSLGFRLGEQGTWKVVFSYDAVTYFQSDSFHTVYQQGGTGALIPGIQPGKQLSWQANLLPESVDDVKTRRDRFAWSGSYEIGGGLTLDGKLFYEHKEGTMEQSLSIGGTANNFYPANSTGTIPVSTLPGHPAAAAGPLGSLVYFPQPIDYDTRRYDLKLKYRSGDFQGALTYSFSSFANGDQTFYAEDPFSQVNAKGTLNPITLANGSTIANRGLPFAAPFSLPPNSSQHAANADFSYRLTPSTNLVGSFQYAVQLVDNAVTPYNVNPNNSPSPAQANLLANPIGGSTNAWNASADIMNANLTLTSRPLADVDFKAAYTLNSYENQSLRTQLYGSGSPSDIATLPTATLVSTCNGASVDNCTVPWAWTKQKAVVEAGYTVMPGTKLSASYTLQETDRRYMLDDHSVENDFGVKLRSRLEDSLFSTVSFDHGVRAVNALNMSAPNEPLELNSFRLANGAYQWFQAGRVSDSVKANLLFSLTDTLSVAFNGQYTKDHYPQITVEGMDRDQRYSLGPQLSWQPLPGLSASLFYNYERSSYHSLSQYGTLCTTAAGVTSVTQATAALPGPICAAGSIGQSAAGWSETNADATHTVGVSIDWEAIEKVLTIGLDYNFSYGDISWAYADNILPATLAAMNPYNQYAWAYQPIPDVTSILSSVNLHGEYHFTPHMSLWVGYIFERQSSSDYNYGVQQMAYASNLLSGDSNPSYSQQIAMARLKLKF